MAETGTWSQYYITNAGRALRQKSIAEGKKIVFTRGAIGTGTPADPSDVGGLSGLLVYVKDITIKTSFAIDANHLMVARIDNAGYAQDVLMSELGIYAKIDDPDSPQEILYGYAYTLSGYILIPMQTSATNHKIYELTLNTYLSATSDIEIIFDSSTIFVSHADLDDIIDDIKADTVSPNHAHTGSDGTPQISYSDLKDKPTSFAGNASTATALQTARNIQTNLASAAAASFNGTANVTPGVTGVLPVANGGTGVNNASTTAQMTVANAVSLQTARTILINLAATAAASFNGTANVAPGVSGTLPVARGGTGTTAIGTLSAISATNAQSAFSTANYTNRYLRNIMMSTGAPAAANGSDGDVWIQYT